MLKKHCGMGEKPHKRSKNCARKTSSPPSTSKPSSSTDSTCAEVPPSSARNQAFSTGTGIGSDPSSTDDDEWVCANCEEPWDECSDDRWILCNLCNQNFQLQCFGVEYQTKNYNTLDIESMLF